MIAEAIGDVLAADSYLTSRLAAYNGNPAIITFDPPPADMAEPLVVIRGPRAGTRDGDRANKGVIADFDVACYADKGPSTKTLREIAWRIWLLLERANLSINGYEAVGVIAAPPRSAPDPDGFPGFIISISAQAIRR